MHPRILPGLVLLLGIAASGPCRAAAADVLPFDMPSKEILQGSPKKVFAVYVPWSPISLDNLPPMQDTYTTQLLNPDGEGGIHKPYGGLLRTRPMPQAPLSDPDWEQRNLEQDVRRAIAVGLDGFLIDIVSVGGPLWNRVVLLMKAAAAVDPAFKIVLMPDMEGVFKNTPSLLAPVVRWLGQFPAAYRVADGRLVVAPFNAQNHTAGQWRIWLSAMKESGVDIAFVPIFQGWDKYAADFQSISYGLSDWGTGSAISAQQDQFRYAPIVAHQYSPVWMAPVRPQAWMPSSFRYWEASGSTNYRKNWMTAIGAGADWVNIATWNEYAEATDMAPSTGTQQAFYDLTAYFATWFKTGRQPVITRDVLYYFHRLQSTGALPDFSQQTGGLINFVPEWPTDARRNQIELLAFLTAPGTLEITIGGTVSTMDAPAGQVVFRVPLAEGRPRFRLLREGVPVIDFASAFDISNSIVYQDLVYRGGSSSRPALSYAR